jgi:hypothetical protein
MPRVLPDRRAPMAPRAGHRVAVDVGGDPPPVVQRRVELRYLRPLLVRGRRVHPGAISLPFPRNLIATSLTSPYLPSPYLPSPSNLQVLLFGILAIEVKRKSPNCHTFLEMVKARWGTMAHIVFTYYAFATNLIVTSMLILGGADCIAAWSQSALPGMRSKSPRSSRLLAYVRPPYTEREVVPAPPCACPRRRCRCPRAIHRHGGYLWNERLRGKLPDPARRPLLYAHR